jgi:hypothetical protein
MHIEIPKDAELLAQGQAESARFSSVDEYVAHLIRRRAPITQLTRQQALEKLRKLRAETPKLSRHEIVDMVVETRAELP